MKTKVIGLTGGIAAGKTMVSNYLLKRGYSVIDADVMTHYLYGISEIRDAIISEFGSEAYDEKGNFNRDYVGSVVFSNPNKRHALNEIMHPAVRKKSESLISELQGILFLDAALLFTGKLDSLCEMVCYVKADREKRLVRLMERSDLTEEEANRMIDSQKEEEALAEACTVRVDIYNDSDLNELYQRVDRLLERITV